MNSEMLSFLLGFVIEFERARGYAIERIVYTSDLLKQNPAIDKERTNSKSATKRRHDFEYRSPLAEEYETETTRRRYSK